MKELSELSDIVRQARELETKGGRENYEKAYEILTKAIKDTQGMSDLHRPMLFNQRGLVLRMLELYDKAFQDYHSALKEPVIYPKEKALAHINIADIYRVHNNDLASAHAFIDEALSFSGNNTLEHALAVNQRGLVFVKQEEYVAAIKSYKRSVEICEYILEDEPDDKEVKRRYGQFVHNLGAAYDITNNLEKAYEINMKAMDVFMQLGDQHGITNALTRIGHLALKRNTPEDALKHYKKAEEILKQTEYKRSITSLSLFIAEAYLSTKEQQKAVPYLQRFSTGILNQEIEPHDIELMSPHFNKVCYAYQKSGLEVKEFEQIKSIFDQ